MSEWLAWLKAGMESGIAAVADLRTRVMELIDAIRATPWQDLGAVASITSAIVAAAGLVFVGVQIRSSRRMTDASTLHDFVLRMEQLEQTLVDAPDQPAREVAFLNLVNYLELLAAGLAKGLFGKVTSEFMRDKLVDTIALIENMGDWQTKLDEARSTQTALKHLFRFSTKKRRLIERSKRALRAREEITSQSVSYVGEPAVAATEGPHPPPASEAADLYKIQMRFQNEAKLNRGAKPMKARL